MFLPKNIGIFGEAEERHYKMIKRMEAMAALLKYIETLEKNPNINPTEQILMDQMLNIIFDRFDELEEDNNEIFDNDRD